MRSAALLYALALSVLLLEPRVTGAAPPRAPALPSVAFVRTYNVYLMRTDGTGARAITTRGSSASNGLQYPWYQWSPDGKYLLLEREHQYGSSNDLLLMSVDGTLLRTLKTGLPHADFPPTWADDRDQIAYVGAMHPAQTNVHYEVDAIDVVQGITRTLFSFSNSGGCGGGTSDPAQQAFWSETGLGGTEPRMQWSVGTHTALYSWMCGAGLRIV
ncbi:MAG TPA: hypothetical protein VHB98_15825, partial [Chloroflexota bacterium]|nr:hypothetical protein [Chloroflexota bacterium]